MFRAWGFGFRGLRVSGLVYGLGLSDWYWHFLKFKFRGSKGTVL